MSRLAIIETPIPALKIIERERIGDERGFLERLFSAEELTAAGWPDSIVQINRSYTRTKGSVRGMHFQHMPDAEAKLVSCVKGEIWDVAIDLRANSPSFLKWHAEILSEANRRAFLIPEGFAHGFQTLEDDCELIYLHSAAYVPQSEAGLNPRDPHLAIEWPLAITELSERDEKHPWLADGFRGVLL